MTALLRAAARACGIATSYLDYKGDRIVTPDVTLKQMIALLRDTTPEKIVPRQILQAVRAEKIAKALPAVIVAWDGAFPKVWIWTERNANITGATLEEDGPEQKILHPGLTATSVIGRSINGKPCQRLQLQGPADIPFGYYTLRLAFATGEEKSAFLISAPRKLRQPEKSWGVFAPAYALRGQATQGIGGYSDLKDAATFIHAHGGGFFGTLPLLPLFYEGPNTDPSPYAPVSRLFWNEIFLDVTDLPGNPDVCITDLQACNADDLVDYPKVYTLKKLILQESADDFFAANPGGDAGFRSYQSDNPYLDAYADFHAARAPEHSRAAVRRYHLYAQYACHCQMKALKDAADAGECASLYIDYTVGVHTAGFDAQTFPHLFLKGAQAGAPPDEYFTGGQGWGFYPFHPQSLATEKFAYVRTALAHYFEYARIIRLDHVMGFYRIYCIPEGASPAQGAYIYRPLDALLAILCLETHRHDGVLIGENLGTVSSIVNSAMHDHGIHGMWLGQFEMRPDPIHTFDSIKPDMIAVMNTHDMYPLAAFLESRDIAELREKGLLAEPQAEKLMIERRRILGRWRELGDLFATCLRGLARSPADYAMVSLEDFWSETEPQNIPGTVGGENWRRKLAVAREDWPQCTPLIKGFDILNRNRRNERMAPPLTQHLLTGDDLYYFNEGSHTRLYEKLGAHIVKEGVHFAVWAPNAEQVSVIGDFNFWTKNKDLLYPVGNSGIWAGIVPEAKARDVYKYHIRSRHNNYEVEKADPFAFCTETPPNTGSVIWDSSYEWHDGDWMKSRQERQQNDRPLSIYELHLGSWRRKVVDNNRPLSYDELSSELIEYVLKMGFTHVEFMPLMEHPFGGSWGYQTTGYYAPTRRYGDPQALMHLIDKLHQAGIGVILDWVPSHFPSDQHGLSYFDGTHLYEHEDPRQGYHPDWNSCIYNYSRNEVRAFLISNAMFWLDRFHADGLRVDAVASMIYLDYSRKAGEWIPNKHGGRENLEALGFLRDLNIAVHKNFPGIQMIAEESTAWPMVSRPVYAGGLGFDEKWDMGWMHDTIKYFQKDPIHRRHHQNEITFRSVYAFHENFALPLSHDEVVHGKGSMIGKMPGDDWQKFANLRCLYTYMYSQPGKKLLFMGDEFAQRSEWNHDSSLEWHLLECAPHANLQRLITDLNHIYRTESALQLDFDPEGFQWIDSTDHVNSVISYLRKDHQGNFILCVFNFTPVPRHNYQIGVPRAGFWQELFNSDAAGYGGSNCGNGGMVKTAPLPKHGHQQLVTLSLPPLGGLFFKWKP